MVKFRLSSSLLLPVEPVSSFRAQEDAGEIRTDHHTHRPVLIQLHRLHLAPSPAIHQTSRINPSVTTEPRSEYNNLQTL